MSNHDRRGCRADNHGGGTGRAAAADHDRTVTR